MKYVIFGDMHGKSLKPLEERLEKDNPKDVKLICLGDFDDADVILEAKDLIKKYNGVVVPGNHDEMLSRDYVDFESGTFGPGKNAFLYAMKLRGNPKAGAYLKEILKQQTKLLQIVSEYGPGNSQFSNAIVVHGGLDGNLSSLTLDEAGIEKLWYRLYIKEILCDAYAEDNFKEMKKIGCNMMIRGHDHIQSYAYKRENGSIDAKSKVGVHYNLFPTRMHIINPGAYFKGDYAVINTECLIPKLSFHNLDGND